MAYDTSGDCGRASRESKGAGRPMDVLRVVLVNGCVDCLEFGFHSVMFLHRCEVVLLVPLSLLPHAC